MVVMLHVGLLAELFYLFLMGVEITIFARFRLYFSSLGTVSYSWESQYLNEFKKITETTLRDQNDEVKTPNDYYQQYTTIRHPINRDTSDESSPKMHFFLKNFHSWS